MLKPITKCGTVSSERSGYLEFLGNHNQKSCKICAITLLSSRRTLIPITIEKPFSKRSKKIIAFYCLIREIVTL